jgi:hypothetical protein
VIRERREINVKIDYKFDKKGIKCEFIAWFSLADWVDKEGGLR